MNKTTEFTFSQKDPEEIYDEAKKAALDGLYEYDNALKNAKEDDKEFNIYGNNLLVFIYKSNHNFVKFLTKKNLGNDNKIDCMPDQLHYLSYNDIFNSVPKSDVHHALAIMIFIHTLLIYGIKIYEFGVLNYVSSK